MENVRVYIPLLEGEFNPPWKIRSRAQILFLDIVMRVTPTPLYSLRDEILPKYREAFEFERKEERSAEDTANLATGAVVDLLYSRASNGQELPREVGDLMNAHPLIYDAGAALLGWSERFNLQGTRHVPYCRDNSDRPQSRLQDRCWPILTALRTVLFWQFHPKGSKWERPDPPRWCPPFLALEESTPEPELLPPIQLRVSVQNPDNNESQEVNAPGWYLEFETELKFRRRMTESFNRWMDDHVASRRRSACAAGLEETPGKQKLMLHFTWAAKYQIDKVSPATLAREWNVKADAVEAGIHVALDLIGLERRPPQRGGKKITR